jgi:dolichol-phosphate mannosyltransferase
MVIIALPAYNEEGNLPPLLEKIQQCTRQSGWSCQVIVVNDGSTDRTGEMVRTFEGELEVTLIEHEVNQGLPAALRTGLRAALERSEDDDVIVIMDADNTHAPALISRMVQCIHEGCDLVIASRFVPGAHVRGLSRSRAWTSWGASVLFRVFKPIKGVRDYTCGYRAYRASLLRRAFEEYGDALIDRPGFSCMADLLLKIRRFDAIIVEVPLILRYDLKEGISKMNVRKTVWETLQLLLKAAPRD